MANLIVVRREEGRVLAKNLLRMEKSNDLLIYVLTTLNSSSASLLKE